MGRLVKYKIEKIGLPTLGYRVYVVITKDFRGVAKKIGLIDRDDEIKEKARALCCHSSGISYMFFKPDADPGEVVHETWHAIYRAMKHIGAEIENEIIAYHLEYVVSMAIDVLKKWAKKIS
jgi:hypothetical protein